jgi:hypothetical protein
LAVPDIVDLVVIGGGVNISAENSTSASRAI